MGEHIDYVWHFKLSSTAETGGDEDALTEMVREQVSALLRCVAFTSNGAEVRVTGFRFLDAPEREHAIRPAPLDGESGDADPEQPVAGDD